MNIRENMIIDIETEVSDSESDSKTLKFLVDEDLKDLGYNVHSLQVQPAKRHPDSNGVLPLTEEELEEFAMLNKSSPNVVVFISGGQVFCRYDKFEFSVYRYESILWLSNLFELNKEA